MLINNIPFIVELSTILNELKLQLDINGYNLLNTIRDSGDNIQITCPYHSNGTERRPSAGIRKTDGMFHCFACGETHTLQEMISHCFGYYDDLVGAKGWEWLLKNFLTVSIEERKGIDLDVERFNNRTNSCIVGGSFYIQPEELDKYRYYHPYMYKRKLTNEIIELFDIGYDDNFELKDKNENVVATYRCITFPIKDIKGNCLFIARRSVDTKFFHYPSNSEKPIYGLYELSTLDEYPQEIYICESMLDALTIWVYGKYAVALNGVGSYKQFKVLSKMPCRKFILATDNDSAGQKARSVLRRNIKNKIITELQLPQGKKDINELTKDEFYNCREVF